MLHEQSKDVDGWYHFIRDMVQRGAVRLDHIGTNEQVTNILTMPLGKVMFLIFCENFGIMERPYSEGLVGRRALGALGGFGDSFSDL